ncbi:MAG: rubredoxin [Fibrobacteria bacterium]|nr:rubredoxin [Fibrobacteria bacterium]
MLGRRFDDEAVRGHNGKLGTRRFICIICGWIYDESVGDPDSGLAPGTLWEAIPETWKCPVCGVRKGDFEPFPY